jgi:nucleotide-binding universal stress UspA family protein
MIHIQRILCPIDFSDFSRRALDHALVVAHWYKSRVTLLHVKEIAPLAAYAPGSGVLPSAMLAPEDRQSILEEMRQLASTEAGPGADVAFEIAEGHVADAIVSRASEGLADLIVLGTHGRSGFERLVLGSVTEKVLRKAACPVLTVPRAVGDVVPASPSFKRILCAIDFSKCSMHALEYTFSLAQEANAHVTVLHVVEVPSNLETEAHETTLAGPRSLQEYIAATESERRARLTEAIPDSVRTYCTVDTVLATGSPYREILRVASERTSDLIVMGIHGRQPMDLLFLGSTAQHVVRQAACPVLTLRHG